MPPTFSVELEATLTHTMTVEVEADSLEDAMEKAQCETNAAFCAECSNFGWSEFDWEVVAGRQTEGEA